MGIIECHNITKQFGDFKALDDITISIPQGEIFGLLGPNGAGKTTILRIINQIINPTSGAVLYKGNPITIDIVKQIGYLPEERGLYRKMKVGEQAIFLARLKGMSSYDAKRKLMAWFEKFNIQSWWEEKVETLSKGMAQKVQFIVSVVHNPTILILDEPFSGFDPINAQLIRNEILQLKNNGTTIVLSTHNMESVEELCDNIALINKAKLVVSGNTKQIREQHSLNSIEVIYREDNEYGKIIPNVSFSVLADEKVEEGRKAIINVETSAKDVLTYLIEQNIEVISYKKLLPKMNDIFIKLVND